MTTVKLAPSILAADFACLGDQVAEAERAGADRIHVDVMDGHFVPNLSMGAVVVQSLRRVTRLPLEVHLMIFNPDFFLDEFAQAGADSFLVHWEGNTDLSRTVQRIKALEKRAGVAINPATPASVLEEIMPDLDQVLVMTVNPGFGHQHFLPTTLPKISRAREIIERIKPPCSRRDRRDFGAAGGRRGRRCAGGGIGDFQRQRRHRRRHGAAAGCGSMLMRNSAKWDRRERRTRFYPPPCGEGRREAPGWGSCDDPLTDPHPQPLPTRGRGAD